MGGVDNIDKDKKVGGGFTKKALFMRWYYIGLLGVFDFMVVNSQFAWNVASVKSGAGF